MVVGGLIGATERRLIGHSVAKGKMENNHQGRLTWEEMDRKGHTEEKERGRDK